jgi:hypothetical protein
MPNYTVKNVKNFLGREGHGFNATLYRDGVKVAFVRDMADGGPIRYEWEGGTEEVVFGLHAKAQPPVTFGAGHTLPMSADIFMSRLVDDSQFKKKLAAGLKKRTYFIHDNQCFSNKNAFTPAVSTALSQRYPGVVFLNSLPIDEAYQLYAQHAVKY